MSAVSWKSRESWISEASQLRVCVANTDLVRGHHEERVVLPRVRVIGVGKG